HCRGAPPQPGRHSRSRGDVLCARAQVAWLERTRNPERRTPHFRRMNFKRATGICADAQSGLRAGALPPRRLRLERVVEIEPGSGKRILVLLGALEPVAG